MRLDEKGNECPATLGEYRDYCAALFGGTSSPVRFLDEKIATNGRDDLIVITDLQMRGLLFSMFQKDRANA